MSAREGGSGVLYLATHPVFPAPDSFTYSVVDAPPAKFKYKLPGGALTTELGEPDPVTRSKVLLMFICFPKELSVIEFELKTSPGSFPASTLLFANAFHRLPVAPFKNIAAEVVVLATLPTTSKIFDAPAWMFIKENGWFADVLLNLLFRILKSEVPAPISTTLYVFVVKTHTSLKSQSSTRVPVAPLGMVTPEPPIFIN
jgi:hypothetical protein